MKSRKSYKSGLSRENSLCKQRDEMVPTSSSLFPSIRFTWQLYLCEFPRRFCTSTTKQPCFGCSNLAVRYLSFKAFLMRSDTRQSPRAAIRTWLERTEEQEAGDAGSCRHHRPTDPKSEADDARRRRHDTTGRVGNVVRKDKHSGKPTKRTGNRFSNPCFSSEY